MAATARAKPLEEGRPFLGQDDVADLVGLADTNSDRAGVGIEVPDLQVCEFTVAGAGLQRRRARAAGNPDRLALISRSASAIDR